MLVMFIPGFELQHAMRLGIFDLITTAAMGYHHYRCNGQA